METVTSIPVLPGAVVHNKPLNKIYVLDERGVWSTSGRAIETEFIVLCLTEYSDKNEILSWGVEPRIDEPQGLGAVVDIEYSDGQVIRWVRASNDSSACWRATGGGLSSWSGWADGKITVRHEGWNEQ